MEQEDPKILYSQEYDAGAIGLLESITQVHDDYILGAINELQDNAIEAGAQNQWVKLEKDRNLGYALVLSLCDDGIGLDKGAWSRLLAVGERKGNNNYGVGCKSGSFSIGNRVLVFSKHKGPDGELLWGASLFRRGCPHGKECSECGEWKARFKPPVVFWRGDGSAITEANYQEVGRVQRARGADKGKLSEEGVKSILKQIYDHSIIKSVEGLEDQFGKIRSETGSLVLIYQLETDEGADGRVLEVDKDQDRNPDIRVKPSPGGNPFMRSTRSFVPGTDIPLDYSLRSQAELLLRRAQGQNSRMIKFWIQDEEVKPRTVEDMCQYGEMKDCDFGLDAKNNVVAFEDGAIKVEYKLGFSPEAYDKELSGLFLYYDKGNGDPLRLVESYQISARPDVLRGMLGVAIVRPSGQAAKSVTMHNGKQQFNPTRSLQVLKNAYFWSGCDSLVEFSSEEAKSIRKQAKKKMASGLEAALKEADNGKRGQRRYLTVCIQVSDRERYLPYKHCRCDADRTVVSRSYLTGGLASNLYSCGGRVRRLP